MDERDHSQLGDVVAMLQECGKLDDEMKSKLRDIYRNVTELGASRETQLRNSLLVRDKCL